MEENNKHFSEKEKEEMKYMIKKASENKKERKKREKRKFKIELCLQILFLLFSIFLMGYSILFVKENIVLTLITDVLLVIIALFFLFQTFSNKEKHKLLLKNMSYILLLTFIGVTFITRFLENKEVLLLGDFTNQKVSEVLTWADANKIQIEQSFEYSDEVEEYGIIRQDLIPATPLKDVSILKLVISLGPNYDKKVILSDLSGLSLERLQEEINKLYLNNVEINYEINDEFEKDTILKQSFKGEMRRNDKVIFTLSLGNKENLEALTMIDLKGKSKFEAVLWLEQNGISYSFQTDFSTEKIDTVLSQDIKEGTEIKPLQSKVNLILSKGEKIIVPNLLLMTSDEIVNWIVENDLKIEFSDRYDTKIELGKVIEANYKENDEISSGTLIKVVTSKGQLKMPKFNSVAEFRTWASTYNITYKEDYQMNDSVKKGDIIKFSYTEGDVIDLTSTITVTISSGKAITIPNFYGKNKTTILSSCNNLGLNCSFYDAGYSSLSNGLALSQNMKVGSIVTQGTYVKIGLSKGIAKTFTIQINQSSIQSCAGNSSCTINLLKASFASNYPGVTFNFVTKASSVYQFAGNIHESSPIKDGSKVTQGKTYNVWITN